MRCYMLRPRCCPNICFIIQPRRTQISLVANFSSQYFWNYVCFTFICSSRTRSQQIKQNFVESVFDQWSPTIGDLHSLSPKKSIASDWRSKMHRKSGLPAAPVFAYHTFANGTEYPPPAGTYSLPMRPDGGPPKSRGCKYWCLVCCGQTKKYFYMSVVR